MRALAEQLTLTVFENSLWGRSTWLGLPILQLPNDLQIMQELITRTRPRAIVETGTYGGGSAIFYSSILSLIGGGRVISVDIAHGDDLRRKIAEHPFGSGVTLITGDSAAPETVSRVRNALAGETNVMVALDSDHRYQHVLAELRAYSQVVPVGGYLVVFDTIVEAISKLPGHEWKARDNPKRALETFLDEDTSFEVDRSCDRLMVSFCPGGFLKRVR